MRQIWNYENTIVLLTGVGISPDPSFTGVVQTGKGMTFIWEAFVSPQGYRIEINSRLDGKPVMGIRGMQSPTFNLGLEVARAAQQA